MYVSMTAIQADVLVSNKVNIPGGKKKYNMNNIYDMRPCQVPVIMGSICSGNKPSKQEIACKAFEKKILLLKHLLSRGKTTKDLFL